MSLASVLVDGLAALRLAPSSKSRQLAESLIRESEVERLQARQSTAAALATAEAAELAAVRVYRQDLEPLQARVDALQAELEAARLKVALVAHARCVAAIGAGQGIDRLRGSLRQTASPMLPVFVKELREMLQETYKQQQAITFKSHLDGKNYLAWSNADSFAARVAALRAAIDRCLENGSLPYLPLDDVALQVELDRLRDAIPPIAEPPESVLRQAGAIV